MPGAKRGSPALSRISEKEPKAFARWQGDDAARRAVYNNRARLKSTVAHQAFSLRAEKVERSFALILDIGGLRRTWLRGAENVEKRYLIQVAAHNLGRGSGTASVPEPRARRRRSSGSSVTSARLGVLRSGRSLRRRAQTRGQRPELRRLC